MDKPTYRWNLEFFQNGCCGMASVVGMTHTALRDYKSCQSPTKGEIEDRIASVIFKKYNLEYPFSSLIKYADLTMLNTEAYYLLPSKGNNWDMWETIKRPKVDFDRRPLGLEPEVARNVFMTKFVELTTVNEEATV